LGSSVPNTPLGALLPIGSPGCLLLASPQAVVLLVPQASAASTSFAVPRDIGLVGVSLFEQFLQLSMNAQKSAGGTPWFERAGARDRDLLKGCTLRLLPPFVPFVTTSNGHGFRHREAAVAGRSDAARARRSSRRAIALDATAPLGVTLTAALRLALGD
jgi:hypothetical protein